MPKKRPKRYGRVAGIPYDFRRPTWKRMKERMWNREDGRLFTPKSYGIGWTLNFRNPRSVFVVALIAAFVAAVFLFSYQGHPPVLECESAPDCPAIYCIRAPCPQSVCVDGRCVMEQVVVYKDDVESDKLEMALPIRKDEVSHEAMGIWPFGVRGGDHPFGHPGIDFEAYVGTEILAAAGGRISYVGDSGHYGQKTFSIHVGTHDIVYTAPMEVLVSEGQQVEKGDVVARMEAWEGKGDIGWLHFGVSTVPGRESLCPADFFGEQAAAEIEGLHGSSTYQERTEFPLLCNPCPDGGCR